MSWVGFDVETAGELQEYALQPWRLKDGQAWVRTWAESTAEGNFATPAPLSTKETAKQLRALVEKWVANDTTVCVWNGPFDIGWLAAYGLSDLIKQVKWLDGMLLWRHLAMPPEYDVPGTKRKKFKLKLAVAEFFPRYAGYDEGIDFEGDILALLHYNAADAWFTRALTRMFYLDLEKNPQALKAAIIESHCLPYVAIANYEGMSVSEEGLDRMDEALAKQAEESLAILSEHGATEKILKSPQQLAKLMFDDWGLKPIKHGKTGPSTDKETLNELGLVDDRVIEIGNFREAVGNRKKFCTNILASVEYSNDSRTHPLARIFGTYSGRFTYASKQGENKDMRQIGFALHQMKRSAEYRQVIKAPPGHTVVELDAASQEYRWMAILSGDDTMLKLCMPGEDPHSYMGSQVMNVPYREIQEGAKEDEQLGKIRQMGKVGNLSLQYRTSAKKLLSTARTQHKMMIDFLTAERIWRAYRQTYPGVPRYWERQIKHVKRYMHVDTLAGRRVIIPRRLLAQWEWSVESTSINYPVQGTGADQKYLAMSVLRPLLKEMVVQFAFDLHDGLYFFLPDEEVDDFIPAAKYMLDNMPYEKAWGFTPPVPLPWDVKVGKTWGGMKELEL